MRLYRIIKKPITTEKTSSLTLIKNVYVFDTNLWSEIILSE